MWQRQASWQLSKSCSLWWIIDIPNELFHQIEFSPFPRPGWGGGKEDESSSFLPLHPHPSFPWEMNTFLYLSVFQNGKLCNTAWKRCKSLQLFPFFPPGGVTFFSSHCSNSESQRQEQAKWLTGSFLIWATEEWEVFVKHAASCSQSKSDSPAVMSLWAPVLECASS